MVRKQGSTKRKFRKVREGWDFVDDFTLAFSIILFVCSIHLTLKVSPYFIFLNMCSLIVIIAGLSVLGDSKVYWEEIEEWESPF